MKKILSIFFIHGLCFGESFNAMPWIDSPLTPKVSSEITYECFNQIENTPYSGRSLFLDFRVPFAISADYDFFIGTLLSDTHKKNFSFDSFSEGIRVSFYDDARGDVFALTTALEANQVLRFALNDPSIFHHGLFEGFFSTSIGKELSVGPSWIYRGYGNFGVGLSEIGEAWVFCTAALKGCFCNEQCISIFGDFEAGFGKKKIDLCNFNGYGKIAYRALDLGVRYSFQSEYGVIFTSSIYKRVYSKNAPEGILGVSFNLDYPFAL